MVAKAVWYAPSLTEPLAMMLDSVVRPDDLLLYYISGIGVIW